MKLDTLPPTIETRKLTPISDDDLRIMLMIRHFELSLLELFSSGKLNGTTHTCLGQEYIPVALRAVLTDDDFILSNHRGHGHYLARFQDPEGLLAEIMGKEGAVCHGVGGSQHIYRKNYLSTGIQGESLPVAAGIALHLRRQGNLGMAVVHIGDGTWGEGGVYEALNIAQLWHLPVLVIVENNKIAQSTPNRLQMAGTIAGRVQGFGINYLKINSIDINEIRTLIRPYIQVARTKSSPLVIEFETNRVGPHSKGDDTRDIKELERIQKWDWYSAYRQQYPAQFEHLGLKVQTEVSSLIKDVEARELVQWKLL
ncbi:MAG TPA: thiamine pyrophosphate-dependent dehydrogenase E1 component subunit alpha [Trichormus sp. M33_DOE_039]|nr:thiamine pyrophosphate-dependent dehydrogenase E1 component subunit alpha [Trichormus sp. M33_DOE_039]